MNTLSELRDFFLQKEIEIKDFNGWSLKVGKDTWLMSHGVFYRNGMPQSLKEKGLFDNYRRKKQNDSSSTQTRNWRGIGGRNLLRDGEHD